MTWLVMQRSVWNDIVNWRTRCKYNTSWTRNSRTNIYDKRLRNIVHDYKHILTDIERAKSVRSSFGRTFYGKGNLRKSCWCAVGRRFLIENAYSYTVKKGYSYLCMWDDIKLTGKKQNIDPMWKVLKKEVDLGEPTSLIMYTWDVIKDNVK